MKTDDFDYDLPETYIAQTPAEPRDSCKLMVVGRDGGLQHRIFSDITDYLYEGDLLVVNETRVFPARLLGRKAQTGGAVETLLLDRILEGDTNDACQTWNCLVKPGKRLKPGARIEYFEDGGVVPVLYGEVVSVDEGSGSRAVLFTPRTGSSFDEVIHRIGHTPLPPYIKDYAGDEELYQTVYAKREKSAAAPTAGLHFTQGLLERIKAKGVGIAYVDLEVGLDTFRLVAEDDPTDHTMHSETYTVSEETVEAIRKTKEAGGRVIAVGTTTVRSLESAAASGTLQAQCRQHTSLFILPGYAFRVVDAIVTNFHVPRSTLMMLVSAFSGRDVILSAYEEAKRRGYRFFSFGDAMLLL